MLAYRETLMHSPAAGVTGRDGEPLAHTSEITRAFSALAQDLRSMEQSGIHVNYRALAQLIVENKTDLTELSACFSVNENSSMHGERISVLVEAIGGLLSRNGVRDAVAADIEWEISEHLRTLSPERAFRDLIPNLGLIVNKVTELVNAIQAQNGRVADIEAFLYSLRAAAAASHSDGREKIRN